MSVILGNFNFVNFQNINLRFVPPHDFNCDSKHGTHIPWRKIPLSQICESLLRCEVHKTLSAALLELNTSRGITVVIITLADTELSLTGDIL